MLLYTPSEVQNILYEGPLEFSETATNRQSWRNGKPQPTDLPQWQKPRVTIGEPQVWNIANVYREEGKPLPSSLALQSYDSDFFLVRLACSLRRGSNTQIEWARFSVYLRPHNPSGVAPIAFDLWPVDVFDKRHQDIRIAIAPSLKFVEVAEVSLGEVALQIHYNELVPVITAAGVQESTFSWDLHETTHHPLSGVRWFHVVIKCPHSAEGARATFELVADVVTPVGLLQSGIHTTKSNHLSRLICT